MTSSIHRKKTKHTHHLVTQFDDHDFEQLELLARINKIRLPELVRRVCQAYLDKGKVNLRQENIP